MNLCDIRVYDFGAEIWTNELYRIEDICQLAVRDAVGACETLEPEDNINTLNPVTQLHLKSTVRLQFTLIT